MPSLNAAALERIAPELRPAVAPGELRPRVVHFGLGAFHRAHQAIYTENAAARSGEPWGIVAVAPRSTGTVRALRAQDCLYSLTERHPAGAATRVVGSVVEALGMRPDAARVEELLATPDVTTLTLTITEKGYHRRPDTEQARHRRARDRRGSRGGAGRGPHHGRGADRLGAGRADALRRRSGQRRVLRQHGGQRRRARNGRARLRGGVALARPAGRPGLDGPGGRLPRDRRRPDRARDDRHGPGDGPRRPRSARHRPGRRRTVPAVGPGGLLRGPATAVGARRCPVRPRCRAVPAHEAAAAQRLPLRPGLPRCGGGPHDRRRCPGDRLGRTAGPGPLRRGRTDPAHAAVPTRRPTWPTWSNGSATPGCGTCSGRSVPTAP